MSRVAGAKHARRCAALFPPLIEALRARARDLGYALGVHGSQAYDLDLIAAPWAREAVEPWTLAEELRTVAEAVAGFAYDSDRAHAANPDFFRDGCPGGKPHGRLAWTFHLGGGPYIDLSVMPRRWRPCDCV